jgi:hypothetical protein
MKISKKCTTKNTKTLHISSYAILKVFFVRICGGGLRVDCKHIFRKPQNMIGTILWQKIEKRL